MTEKLTIGRLARRAGVNVETVRYYQRRGLLAEPPKPPGGCRAYPPEAVERLRFIRRAKTLGFTLAEIGALLELDERDCADTRALAERRLADIEHRLADLNAMRRTLTALVARCESRCDARAEPVCPISRALTAG